MPDELRHYFCLNIWTPNPMLENMFSVCENLTKAGALEVCTGEIRGKNTDRIAESCATLKKCGTAQAY